VTALWCIFKLDHVALDLFHEYTSGVLRSIGIALMLSAVCFVAAQAANALDIYFI